MSSATLWLVARLEEERTGSCCGPSAASPMWTLHQDPALRLWSIAAGPLVNVVLFPYFYVIVTLGRSAGWAETTPDLYRLLPSRSNSLTSWPADLQHSSHLSTGWRPDPSLLALVCARTRSQFDGRHDLGLDRSGGIHRSRHLGAIRLVRSYRRLYADELLERPATRAGSLAPGKLPRRDGFACPTCKTAPPVGEYWTVRKVRPTLRHVPNPRSVSPLLDPVRPDKVHGLRHDSIP